MLFRLAVLLLLVGCASPSYYLQATSGQAKLMRQRQDIQSLIDDPATSPALAASLETVEEIRRFAYDILALPDNGSYTSYVEIDDDAMVWNVIATGEFSLQPKQWCFLVAGCVPYRGYFNQQKAIDFATRLDNKGMDTMVSPAAAYSTLGWFEDPLPSTMLGGSDTRLAAFLFHELAHQRLYVKNDGAFNEAYASFVESTGVHKWLESQQRQDELQRWQRRVDAEQDFRQLVLETQDRLSRLYASNQPPAAMRAGKAKAFNTLSVDYQSLRDERWQGIGYYDQWFEKPLNNARIALFDTYEGGKCAFAGLLNDAGGDLHVFHALAKEKSRLPPARRQAWLNQSCSNAAH